MLNQVGVVLLSVCVLAAQAQFKCPEGHGYFPDPKQCDKYYECADSVPEAKYCPDGLVFEIKNPNHVRCDHVYNVDCQERTDLQPAQPSDKCPRKNGYFPHEDPLVCDKFYNCVDGKANVIPCPPGLVYDDYQGTCTWATDSLREGCDQPKKEVLADGFFCPEEEVVGTNGRVIPHPTYPHPKDCQRFYICSNGVQPKEGSCPPGTVYNDETFQCDDPERVQGCEDWFKDTKN